jgi:hypothetical protein
MSFNGKTIHHCEGFSMTIISDLPCDDDDDDDDDDDISVNQ